MVAKYRARFKIGICFHRQVHFTEGHFAFNNTITERSGQIGALLGASGSGKSSLLRAIAGFLPPQQGYIMLDGVVVSSADYQWPAHQRGVGLMFQEHALFPHLRVADNIAFGLGNKATEAAIIITIKRLKICIQSMRKLFLTYIFLVNK